MVLLQYLMWDKDKLLVFLDKYKGKLLNNPKING